MTSNGNQEMAPAGDPGTPKQVAVIGFRCDSDEAEICLIRRRTSHKWGIPKGFIDRGDSPKEAAAKEACEEAGVKGRLSSSAIGCYRYFKGRVSLSVAVYLMEIIEEQSNWLEMNQRERRWFSVADATELLSSHPVRPLLDTAAVKLIKGNH